MKHVFFRSVAGYPSVIEYMLILFRALAYLAGGRVEAVSDLETAREGNLFRSDPDRFLVLEFVKAFPVHSASPFSLVDAEPVRRF